MPVDFASWINALLSDYGTRSPRPPALIVSCAPFEVYLESAINRIESIRTTVVDVTAPGTPGAPEIFPRNEGLPRTVPSIRAWSIGIGLAAEPNDGWTASTSGLFTVGAPKGLPQKVAHHRETPDPDGVRGDVHTRGVLRDDVSVETAPLASKERAAVVASGVNPDRTDASISVSRQAAPEVQALIASLAFPEPAVLSRPIGDLAVRPQPTPTSADGPAPAGSPQSSLRDDQTGQISLSITEPTMNREATAGTVQEPPSLLPSFPGDGAQVISAANDQSLEGPATANRQPHQRGILGRAASVQSLGEPVETTTALQFSEGSVESISPVPTAPPDGGREKEGVALKSVDGTGARASVRGTGVPRASSPGLSGETDALEGAGVDKPGWSSASHRLADEVVSSADPERTGMDHGRTDDRRVRGSSQRARTGEKARSSIAEGTNPRPEVAEDGSLRVWPPPEPFGDEGEQLAASVSPRAGYGGPSDASGSGNLTSEADRHKRVDASIGDLSVRTNGNAIPKPGPTGEAAEVSAETDVHRSGRSEAPNFARPLGSEMVEGIGTASVGVQSHVEMLPFRTTARAAAEGREAGQPDGLGEVIAAETRSGHRALRHAYTTPGAEGNDALGSPNLPNREGQEGFPAEGQSRMSAPAVERPRDTAVFATAERTEPLPQRSAEARESASIHATRRFSAPMEDLHLERVEIRPSKARRNPAAKVEPEAARATHDASRVGPTGPAEAKSDHLSDRGSLIPKQASVHQDVPSALEAGIGTRIADGNGGVGFDRPAQGPSDVVTSPEYSSTEAQTVVQEYSSTTPLSDEGRISQSGQTTEGRKTEGRVASVGQESTGVEAAAALRRTHEPGSPAAGGKASASPAAARIQDAIESQLRPAIRQLIDRQGESSLVLQLRPPELGRVRIEVRSRGKELAVRLEADTRTTHDALRTQLPVLEKALHDQGLQASRIEVHLMDFREQTVGDRPEQRWSSAAPWDMGEDRQSGGKQRGQSEREEMDQGSGWLA